MTDNSHPAGYVKLDLEWQNIIGALKWAYDNNRWALLFKGALGLTQPYLGTLGFLDVRGQWQSARELLSWAEERLSWLVDDSNQALLLTNIGGFAIRQGEYVLGADYLNKALQLLQKQKVTTAVVLQRTTIYALLAESVLQTDLETAVTWLQQALAACEAAAADSLQVQRGFLLVKLAGILGRQGEFETASQTAVTALGLLPAEPTSIKVSGLVTLGTIHFYTGDSAKAMHYWNEGCPIAQHLKDYQRLADLCSNMALNQERTGHYTEAIAYHQQALQLYQFMGAAYGEARVRSNLAGIYIRQGIDKTIQQQLERALQIATSRQERELEIYIHSQYVDYYLSKQLWSLASTHIGLISQGQEAIQLAHFEPTKIRQEAELLLGQGSAAAALAMAETAVHQAQVHEDPIEEGIARRVQGQVLTANQQYAAAESALRTSVHLLGGHDLFLAAQSQVALARCLWLSDQDVNQPTAVSLINEATNTFASLEARVNLEMAQALLSEINQIE